MADKTFSEKELDAMSAEELLTSVAGMSLIDVDGIKAYVPGRGSSERWERVEGGFHCYGKPVTGMLGGNPWGRVLSWNLMQIPWKVKEVIVMQDGGIVPVPNGVHPAEHPGAFEWVWPAAEVRKIYRYASREGADSPMYVKVTDEDTGEETIVKA